MKKLRLPVVCLAALAVVCVVALSLGRRGDPADAEAARPAADTAMAARPSYDPLPGAAPVPVQKSKGRVEIVGLLESAPPPPTIVEPLFEPDARVKIGETTKLRFAVRDRASGMPDSLDDVSASVKHGNDPELKLPVEEVDNGVYEVPFTPRGPGQFTIVLSENGVAIGSEKVGAAGVVGTQANADPDFLSVDPRSYRARTGARGRRRR